MKIVSKKLRNSARGQDCTLNIAGVCNYNPETVVLAHLPDESKGMGTKADDISACFACSACHDYIDGRAGGKMALQDTEWYMRRAMVRTWRVWVESKLLLIK
ncbi:DUF1364 domain-containing protein [Salinispirillum sp. LH 10-3-1]|uniref:DUF1364 domain-containing protein n=1 Tax=Salinispirillum sp. LH 10-3-1 TaxID=2952525 RepID=A0AB38YC12_9GAMM